MEELNNGAALETEGNENQDVNTNGNENSEKEGKYYTDEELDLLLQKAGDKRISQYQKTMEKKQREADKLRSMNAEDKREYLLQERERALEEKELELQKIENKSAGMSVLADKGLSPSLIDFVLDTDADTMYENIKIIEKAFKASVRAEVEKRLSSKAPKKAEEGSMTKAEFNKLPLSVQQQMYEEDPVLIENLI